MSDFLEGGVIGAATVAFVIFYFQHVNQRLMKDEKVLTTPLSVSKAYKGFVVVLAAGLVAIAVLLNREVSYGNQTNVAFIAVFLVVFSLFVFAHINFGFFSQVQLTGNEIKVKTLFGESSLRLSDLVSASINDNLFTFVLSDESKTVRFSHYVIGKRAVIEHILSYAPDDSTEDLRLMLEQADSL